MGTYACPCDAVVHCIAPVCCDVTDPVHGESVVCDGRRGAGRPAQGLFLSVRPRMQRSVSGGSGHGARLRRLLHRRALVRTRCTCTKAHAHTRAHTRTHTQPLATQQSRPCGASSVCTYITHLAAILRDSVPAMACRVDLPGLAVLSSSVDAL